METKKCGDCIHADVCKQLNGGWFSRENPAYCKAFKDKRKYVEVVYCRDCKHFNMQRMECENEDISTDNEGGADYSINFYLDDFCSYGERKDDA